ncbi:MAG: hypothetical protein R3305_06555, partial [Gammaproteobacteria bacterium]|nr:hypothetical protein [Gammaproteobacteria bacterium]
MKRSAFAALLLLTAHAGAEIADIRQGTNMSPAVDPAGERIVVDLLGGLWLLPLSGGGATALLPAGSGVAQPRFDAAGERVVFQRWLDDQWDIWMLTLADGETSALTETPFNEREPDFSADGRSIVFAGDRDGRYALWSLDLGSGALRQLTDERGQSRFPTVGRDGRIVYAHQLDGFSSLRVTSGGPEGEVVVRSSETLSAPSWRPNGGVIVFIEQVAKRRSDLNFFIDADEPILRRATAGEDVFTGRVAWISPAEYVYAADGQLWRRGIASQERTPIHLFAAVDVPSLLGPATSGLLDVPDLEPAAPAPEPYVIQAGRLFDGIGNEYKYLVDIHIAGRRITDVVRRGRLPLPDRVIDASDLTVVPGLIDAHTHDAPALGAEVGGTWLAHGVTTIRILTAEPTAAIERAEIWAAGEPRGPRVVIAALPGAAGMSLSPATPVVAGTDRIGWDLAHSLAEQQARN